VTQQELNFGVPTDPESADTLWQAADKPRGAVDAAKYKHVVLGLLFLKYIFGLTPGRYADAEEREDDAEPLTEKYPRLLAELEQHFAGSHKLEQAIRTHLKGLGHGG